MKMFLVCARQSIYLMLAILGAVLIGQDGSNWTLTTTFGLVMLVVCSVTYTFMITAKELAVEPKYRFYSKDLDRYFEVEKIYTAGDQFTIRVEGYATTLDGIAQLEVVYD